MNRPIIRLLPLGLLLLAASAPEPAPVPVVLKAHGRVRVATLTGTARGPVAHVYLVATGTARTLVVSLRTRTAGPTQFVIEPEDGGAILFDSAEKGRDVSLSVTPGARYEIRVFNATTHRQARKPTGYELRIQTI